MAQSRLKCSDVFDTVFCKKVNLKPDQGGLLQIEGKSKRMDWKEIRNNLYHKGPMEFSDAKERIKTGYCEYCQVMYSDIKEHVNGEQHKVYVENTNFESLDKVISSFPLYKCFTEMKCSESISTSLCGDKNEDTDSGSSIVENVDFSVAPLEGVVPTDASDGSDGGVDVGNCVLDAGVNLGGDGNVVGILPEVVRRRFPCPTCLKNVVNLPLHMSTMHGWSVESSKAVVGQFNIQKKKTSNNRHFSEICPFSDCHKVLKGALPRHLFQIHNVAKGSEELKQMLSAARNYIEPSGKNTHSVHLGKNLVSIQRYI